MGLLPNLMLVCCPVHLFHVLYGQAYAYIGVQLHTVCSGSVMMLFGVEDQRRPHLLLLYILHSATKQLVPVGSLVLHFE